MVGSWRIFLWTLPALLAGVNHASAFGGCAGIWYTPSTITSYSYAPIFAYGSAWAVPSCCWPASVVTVGPRTIYANPTPAPPSSTGEPPLNKKQTKSAPKDAVRPVIIATRSPAAIGSQKDLCRVGFWNLSGREVSVTVEGKVWTLPKDKAITLDLPRDFAWQIEQRPQQVERVPEGQKTHELVIR